MGGSETYPVKTHSQFLEPETYLICFGINSVSWSNFTVYIGIGIFLLLHFLKKSRPRAITANGMSNKTTQIKI